LLLVVGHRAGNIHHVDDDSDTLGLMHVFPAPVLLVLPDRHDHRAVGIVDVRGDLPLEGAFKGALEVAERFRTGLADAGVAVAAGDDFLLAARLDAGEGQLFAENGRQLLHRQFNFEDMAARLVARAGIPVAFWRSERSADVPFALADTSRAFLTVAK